jgi:ribosomal protein S18 acetylase RimI-like enzyme
MITIRRANINDAELLSSMGAKTFIETFSGTATDDDLNGFVQHYYNLPQVVEDLSDDEDYFYIACLNDEPAGYLRLKESVSEVPLIKLYRSLELKRIYVLKEFHSQKIGAELMKFAIDFAVEKNYKAMYLSVWEHNEKAKGFYKRWGFINTGFKNDFPIGSTSQTDYWLVKFFPAKPVEAIT